jgi:hypothetical protein
MFYLFLGLLGSSCVVALLFDSSCSVAAIQLIFLTYLLAFLALFACFSYIATWFFFYCYCSIPFIFVGFLLLFYSIPLVVDWFFLLLLNFYNKPAKKY